MSVVDGFRRFLHKRWLLPLVFVLVAVVIGTFGWLLVRNTDTLSASFRLDAAKAALTVATGLVLGGALKFVLDSHTDARGARQQATTRHADQLTNLRNVHDRVEGARLLIPAHRSATTYGELMRDLIEAQVTLLDIRRAATTERRGRWDQGMADGFSDMVGYLQALHEEYRKNFKDASDAERFDAELNDQDYRRVAAEELRRSTDAGASDQVDTEAIAVPRSSNRAWDILQDPALFPVLHDLCSRGPAYRRYFVDPYHAIVRRFLADPTGPALRGDHAAEDVRFARHTRDVRHEVTAACAKAATEDATGSHGGGGQSDRTEDPRAAASSDQAGGFDVS